MHPHQGGLPQGRLSSEGEPRGASHLEKRLHGIAPVDQDWHLVPARAARIRHERRIERRGVQRGRNAHGPVQPLRATVGANRTLGHLLLADLEHERHLALDLLKLARSSAVDARRASVGEILTLDVDRDCTNGQIADPGAHLASLIQVGSEIRVDGLPIVGSHADRAALQLGNRLTLRHGEERHRTGRAVCDHASGVHIVIPDIAGIRNRGRRPPHSSRQNKLHDLFLQVLTIGLKPSS